MGVEIKTGHGLFLSLQAQIKVVKNSQAKLGRSQLYFSVPYRCETRLFDSCSSGGRKTQSSMLYPSRHRREEEMFPP